MRKAILAGITGLVLILTSLVGPATAATRASIISDGLRVDVTFTGKKPTKARMVVGGTSYKLKRSGSKWRTKPLTPEKIAALTGKRAKLKITVGGKKRTVKATITPGGSTTPTTPTGPTTPTAPQALFAAPGVDSVGNPAYEAVKGYFADSTLTDCADDRGWPYCQVEERYGIFENGTQWYCKLTPTSQSDKRAVGNILKIEGAEQKADGAWAVSYAMNSYGDTVYYTVRVAANGAAAVQYWGPGYDFAGPPSEVKTGLRWIRGAKDCSY